ncbi:hypothetical protein ANCCAN_28995, partial [Ancylostoma caninum]
TIAPYDAACAVDWDLFHTLYLALSDSEKKLLSSYGIPEHVIIQYIVKKKRLEAGDAAMRLYIGLLLQEIWKQQPHAAVAERFGVDRGWLQNTLQNATSQAAAIAKFSEKIPSLWPLRLLLPELVQRLSDCVVAELIPLMAIDGVKRGRARQLYAAGYKTVAKVARANYKDLLRDIANLSRFNAIKMVNSAKVSTVKLFELHGICGDLLIFCILLFIPNYLNLKPFLRGHIRRTATIRVPITTETVPSLSTPPPAPRLRPSLLYNYPVLFALYLSHCFFFYIFTSTSRSNTLIP